ncbi:MAG: hypothetical protein Fur0025_02600 [Oscillatoriaceae cyanobacterium]
MTGETPLPSRYHQLRDFLSRQNWRAADRETKRLMLQVMGKETLGYWTSADYREFPCEDLQILDQMWVSASRGRFGFSVQQQIYQSLAGSNVINTAICEAFGDRLGWRVNGNWLYYSELRFSLQAPPGHLPWFGVSKPPSDNLNILEKFLVETADFLDVLTGGTSYKDKGESLMAGSLYFGAFYAFTMKRCNL